jgi:hypothetical protein
MVVPKVKTNALPNFRAITRNEDIYPEPERFNPDRFLDDQVPPAPIFGYGRRCVILVWLDVVYSTDQTIAPKGFVLEVISPTQT